MKMQLGNEKLDMDKFNIGKEEWGEIWIWFAKNLGIGVRGEREICVIPLAIRGEFRL